MVLELEKPRVTELHVRMDCNGCVHKIKKAMHGVDGVYDISIDFAQQKLTVVGRAELDKILRAIKKTRKIATICSHTDPNAPPPEPEPAPAPAPPAAPESAASSQPPAAAEEAPKEPTPPAAPQEDQAAAEAKPPGEASGEAEPKVIEEVHMVHHYPYNYYSASWNRQYESPMYVYPWPMPAAPKSRYNNWVEACEPEYCYYQSQQRAGYGSRNITSIFSEENPNNCAIM